MPDLSLEFAIDGKTGDAGQQAATLEVLLDQVKNSAIDRVVPKYAASMRT